MTPQNKVCEAQAQAKAKAEKTHAQAYKAYEVFVKAREEALDEAYRKALVEARAEAYKVYTEAYESYTKALAKLYQSQDAIKTYARCIRRRIPNR